MPNTTANTNHDIEIAAMKGKAMANLLGIASGTGDLSQDDLVSTELVQDFQQYKLWLKWPEEA